MHPTPSRAMVHVLGAGNIGSLFAAALSRRFDVSLVLRPAAHKKYVELAGSTVRIHDVSRPGVEWEQRVRGVSTESLAGAPLEQLVVAVKAYDVKKALHGVRKHLSARTEVLVVHNGLGVREEVESLWPRAEQRPLLGYATTDAGMRRRAPLWTFDYTGRGRCAFSVPACGRGGDTGDAGNAGDGAATTSRLAAMLLGSQELLTSEAVPAAVLEREQKRKLVVNSVINPLTAVLQCPNGALPALDGLPQHSRLMRGVARESARVLGLDAAHAWDLVLDVIARTAPNLSSMLTDVEQGRTSEIDYISGYVVAEAQRQGVPAPLNRMLCELVKMKIQQTRHEDERAVLPLAAPEERAAPPFRGHTD